MIDEPLPEFAMDMVDALVGSPGYAVSWDDDLLKARHSGSEPAVVFKVIIRQDKIDKWLKGFIEIDTFAEKRL